MIIYLQVGSSMQDGPRILVAAALGKIIEPILRQSLTDARVRIAEDKGAVLRAIGDRLRFDVAVIDLTWMDYAVEYSFDGLDVLDALRHAGRQTPVIFAAQGHGLERDHLDEAVEQPEVVGIYRKAIGPAPLIEAIDIAVSGGRLEVSRFPPGSSPPDIMRIHAYFKKGKGTTAARLAGARTDFQIVPFRGEYYRLPRARKDLISHLIYPIPDPDLPFLGVHLTKTIDGGVTVGPNAVLGFARERYRKGSFRRRDVGAYLRYPGMWRMARSNVRTGARELRNSVFKRGYLRECRKYCPELTVDDLLPEPAGIRAQAVLRDGSLVHDFLFAETPRTLHVCNAPSPAATSAIPIGELIAAELA